MTQGLAGLYKGYMIHVLLEGVGRGWYMMTYETMKRRLFPQFAEAQILKSAPRGRLYVVRVTDVTGR
jgi:hypothetical protein